MRLVEAGKVDLDATVRTYLPEFATSDPAVADVVTIRMLLNHTPGWLGDDFQDFGRGADAVTQYAASIADLPMLTPPGSAFFYNNAAVALAGRVIEVVTGQEYEQAIQDLLLDPLRLDHTRFFTDDLVGYSTSAGHSVVDGKAQLETSFWYLPRSIAATGGLQSSVRDQLRYARFHLGHSSISGGPPILSAASLATMRSDPGPGGTLVVELDGMGVTWQLRPSAEGVRIVQHGGNWPGQHSGFLFVPERDFAITVLTNSLGGPRVISDLFFGDWALSRFAGLHNLPAETQTRTEAELAAYAGRFTVQGVDATGTTYTNPLMLTPVDGRLRYRILDENDDTPLDPQPGTTDSLAFYRDDFLLMIGADGNPAGGRCNFVRDPAGNVRWLLSGGRLFRKDPP